MWSDDLLAVKNQYQQWASAHQQQLREARKSNQLPHDLWLALAQLGLFENGLHYNGQDGLPYLAAALEGITYGLTEGGLALSLTSHLGLCLNTISTYASSNIKQDLLKQIAEGKLILAFAITEPHGGFDAPHLYTQLDSKDEKFILNGKKWMITNAPIADWIITFAQETKTDTPTSMLVNRHWDGVHCQAISHQNGLGASPTGEITFTNVCIPKEYILHNVGSGLEVLNNAFIRERLLAPFLLLGMMQRVLDEILAYAFTRRVGEHLIGENQYLRRRMSEMALQTETTRSLAHRSLLDYIQGKNVTMLASMAKMHAANCATQLIDEAIHIYGSYAFINDDLLQMLQTTRASTIAGGTEEAHRETIMYQLYLHFRHLNRKKLHPENNS